MLGTNDCKQRFSATAGNIASGIERLARQAMAMAVWQEEPRLLIVAPSGWIPGSTRCPMWRR